MFEKVKGILTKGLDAVKTRLNQFQQPIKWIVIGYLVTVFLLCFPIMASGCIWR